MDSKEFKLRLAQVAVIKDIKPTSLQHIKKQFEMQFELDSEGNEIVIQVPIAIENPTLGVELVKVKTITKLCEMGCGRIVDNQKIEKRFASEPKPHWKTKCVNCGCYLAPDGETLLDGSNAAQAAFRSFLTTKNK